MHRRHPRAKAPRRVFLLGLTGMLALLALPAPFGAAGSAEAATQPAGRQDTPSERPVGGFVQVLLVRHAEKADEPGPDPALSAKGEARAAALRRLLAHSGVTHLYASEFQRTQRTLAPLAESAGLELAVRGAREAEALVAELRALPAGSVAVVAGHSNTVPQLSQRFGVELERLENGNLVDDAYDRLFVLTFHVAGGRSESASPAPAACLELSF